MCIRDRIGTSAGGQHPKAIIAINETTHDIRSGQVPLPEGYTYYLSLIHISNGMTGMGKGYTYIAYSGKFVRLPCTL